MAQAFALREEYQGSVTWADEDGDHERPRFVGATTTLRDGTALDVAKLLEDGGDVIVTEDTETILGLRSLECLKEVPVPDQHPTLLPLLARRMQDLLELPEARALDKRPATKAELVARIQLAQAGQDPNQPLVSEGDPEGRWVPDPAADTAGDQADQEGQS